MIRKDNEMELACSIRVYASVVEKCKSIVQFPQHHLPCINNKKN